MTKKFKLGKTRMIKVGPDEHEVVLYQIIALCDFGSNKKGDIGGWVQKEENLAQVGNCWIKDDACVFESGLIIEDATVFGSAKIYGNAILSGNSIVHENAQIFGNSKVCNNALIYGDAKIYGNSTISGYANIYGKAVVSGKAHIEHLTSLTGGKWTETPLYISVANYYMFMCDNSHLQISSTIYTIKQWLKGGIDLIKTDIFTKEQCREFTAYIKLFEKKYSKEK